MTGDLLHKCNIFPANFLPARELLLSGPNSVLRDAFPIILSDMGKINRKCRKNAIPER
jgi:hypothetical protein